MVFINDPRGTSYDANAVFSGCHVDGFPVAYVSTNRDIQEGEQVLARYGKRFWSAKRRTCSSEDS